MENKIFLEQMKIYYDSLKYFEIIDGYLSLTFNNNFKIPLRHVSLSTLDQNIFSLPASEIFQIIYMYELLYKEKILENEIDFIKNYIKRYLKLSDEIKNNENNELTRFWCLEFPINNAYKEEFSTLPTSKIIIDEIDKHTEKINSGLGKVPKLILTKGDNPNFEIEEQVNQIRNFEKAGFTTIFLIIGAITATCIFIATFIMNH